MVRKGRVARVFRATFGPVTVEAEPRAEASICKLLARLRWQSIGYTVTIDHLVNSCATLNVERCAKINHIRKLEPRVIGAISFFCILFLFGGIGVNNQSKNVL